MDNDSGTDKKENNSLYYLAAVLIGFIAAFKGIANQPRTECDDDNAEEDALIRHTKRLGWATVVIAVVGVLSFAAALLQWDALRDANKATREAFSAVQRPFIIATGPNFSQQAYGATSPQYWEFQTILENSGNTPTKNMTIISSVSFSVPLVPDTSPDPADLTTNDHPPPVVANYFIGPHGKVGIWAISLLFKTVQEMAQSRSDFYMYGIARYWDQFSDTPQRLTKFCIVVRPVIANGVEHFGYNLCHHWNCGDEDCQRDERDYKSDLSAILKQNPKAAGIMRQIPIAAILPHFPAPWIKAQ